LSHLLRSRQHGLRGRVDVREQPGETATHLDECLSEHVSIGALLDLHGEVAGGDLPCYPGHLVEVLDRAAERGGDPTELVAAAGRDVLVDVALGQTVSRRHESADRGLGREVEGDEQVERDQDAERCDLLGGRRSAVEPGDTSAQQVVDHRQRGAIERDRVGLRGSAEAARGDAIELAMNGGRELIGDSLERAVERGQRPAQQPPRRGVARVLA
jgi:hypothetical protein